MKEEIKKIYDEGNDIWGYPQVYKGIKIYPIKIKDTEYQKLFYHLLTRPKDFITNAEILRASYLKFIICVVPSSIDESIETMIDDFTNFMKYITREEKVDLFSREKPGKGLAAIELKFQVGDQLFTEYDFDNFREIILEQNGLSLKYIEDYNPSLEEYLIFNNKETDEINLEDQIFTFISMLQKTPKDIEEYSLHQFNRHFERMRILKEYDMYKPLIISGQINLKSGEIKHYLYHAKKGGRYDSILVNREDFEKGEISQISQKVS